MAIESAPVVLLSNGLRVANFSSPHPFTFSDGSKLEACSAERAKHFVLEQIETEHPRCGGYTDISLEFKMTAKVLNEINLLETDSEIDIILVPFPVMEAFKKNFGGELRYGDKIRVCRVADRVTKTICHDKFCV